MIAKRCELLCLICHLLTSRRVRRLQRLRGSPNFWVGNHSSHIPSCRGSNDLPKSLNAARPVKQSRLCGIPIASLGRMDELEGLVTDQSDGGIAKWLRLASQNYHLRPAGRKNFTLAKRFASLAPVRDIKSRPVSS